jgi:hypothetical protein
MIVTDVAVMGWIKGFDPALILSEMVGGAGDSHGGEGPGMLVEHPVGRVLYGAAAVGVILVVATAWVVNTIQNRKHSSA